MKFPQGFLFVIKRNHHTDIRPALLVLLLALGLSSLLLCGWCGRLGYANLALWGRRLLRRIGFLVGHGILCKREILFNLTISALKINALTFHNALSILKFRTLRLIVIVPRESFLAIHGGDRRRWGRIPPMDKR